MTTASKRRPATKAATPASSVVHETDTERGDIPRDMLVLTSPTVVINVNLTFSPGAKLPTVGYVADYVRRLRAELDAEEAAPYEAETVPVEHEVDGGVMPFEPEKASS